MATIKDIHGNERLFFPARCPEKHLLVSHDIELALVRGELETMSFSDVCKNHFGPITEQNRSYARSAVRYCLRWLDEAGYTLPEQLAKEIDPK